MNRIRSTVGFDSGIGWRIVVVAAIFLYLPVWQPIAATAEPPSEAEEYFERSVRPLLVEHCQECHGPEQQESGLRVDSRDALLLGGSRGAAIMAGDAEASLLIDAIGHATDDLTMPPDGKLTDEQIVTLKHWIDDGAPWPAGITAVAGDTEPGDVRPSSEHWAFQPLQRPVPPAVVDQRWCYNSIDRFVLARLEQHGLAPSASADRATLARRLYLDLIGLPPTYEQVQSFVNDSRPDAYEQLVDQLLASPDYAERWARHWLDVARFADTKGYLDGGQTSYPFAYTYRNYVLRAIAEDLPIDEFIIDQLAADLLPASDESSWRLAGMGFLTAGLRFNANHHDILDDRIDLITRGLMGVTAACARCHDHKYDPVSIADYYSLYGILASSYEPTDPELPLLTAVAASSELDQYNQRLQEQWDKYRERYSGLHREIEHELRSLAADYLVYVVKSVPFHCADGKNPLKTDRTILRGPSAYGYGAFERWERYLGSREKDDAIWGLWRRMFTVAPEQFVAVRDEYLATHDEINALLRDAIVAFQPVSMVDLARCYGTLLEQTYDTWIKLREADPNAEQLLDADREALRQVLYGADSPTALTEEEAIDCYYLDEHVQLRSLRSDIEKVSVEFAGSPPRAMLLRERSSPFEPRILVRGQPNRPGRLVPRKLPELMSMMGLEYPVQSRTGRWELARAVADPHNPLTYRVLVNRVWQWHFGRALVTTPSDFGARSDPPSHPELLDYLATSLIDNRFSLKKLQRQIVTSHTYRQASRVRPDGAAIDPTNRWLWRFEPRRVEWEVVRDSLLASAQRLERRLYQRPIERSPDDASASCRTMYLRVDRQDLSRLARAFDVASPDFSVGRRDRTTAPQQQLFFLNGDLVIQMSERIVQALDAQEVVSDRQRAVELFRRVLSRDPSEVELAVALQYVTREARQAAHGLPGNSAETDSDAAKTTAEHSSMSAWTKLAQVLLQTNERVIIE